MSSHEGRDSSLAAGHRLDGYELLWPVGEGGMAQVWVARLTRKHGFEKLVAIKTILPKFAEDEAFQKMFLDEARIASRIDHTNVAHIHDLGEKGDILYLVMEYVDGDALNRLRKVLVRKKHEFPIGIALRIMADVCAGLQAAHELRGVDGTPLGVVHRDVSPQNILLTIDGTAKLIDFGVAKAAGRLTEETHTGYVKGKVQYMAPEQALGKNVDRRADLWAVGAVLYHLIANRPPFEADNHLALLAQLQRGRPPDPLPATTPALVQALVAKALTHNVPLRFQTAAEMKSAIERTGLSATAEEVSAFVREHLGELAQRRRDAIAHAIQSLESSSAAPRPAPPSMHLAPGDSTQPIHAADRPAPPPPSSNRGGAAPQAAPGQSAFMAVRTTSPMSAAPISAPPGAMPTGSHGAPPPMPASRPSFVSAPALSAAQLDAAVEDTSSGTAHGSLGLASISATLHAPAPARKLPWIPIGIGVGVGVMMLAVIVGMGFSASRGPKRLDTQFSPLPSVASTLPPAAQAPVHTEEPAPLPSQANAPPPVETNAAAPAPAPPPPAPAPVTRPAPAPRATPSPAASIKKKPRVDDGF